MAVMESCTPCCVNQRSVNSVHRKLNLEQTLYHSNLGITNYVLNSMKREQCNPNPKLFLKSNIIKFDTHVKWNTDINDMLI